MFRARRSIAAASAIVALGLLTPATAGATMSPTAPTTTSLGEALQDEGVLYGLVLSGNCTGGSYDLRKITAVQLVNRMWWPFVLASDGTPLSLSLVPYQIQLVGDLPGLKTRHLIPDDGVFTRPGPMPGPLVSCSFEGNTKEDGPFQVNVLGTVRPGAPLFR